VPLFPVCPALEAIKMTGVVVLLLVAWVICLARAQDKKDCYASNLNPYLNFGTKTAYQHAYNKRGIDPVPDCRPVQLWLVSRHGTRWPSAEDIPEFSELSGIRDHVISNYNANKGTLCSQDIENLRAWSFSMSPDQGDMLTVQGREDLFLLGRRLRSYFPDLLNTSYSSDKLLFRHTNTSRTKESAEYFARGMLGLNYDDPSPSLPPPIADDRLIYPYNNCPAWDTLGSEAKKEQAKFGKSSYINYVQYRVSQRLGFDYNLTLANLKNIYDGCRYQKAWNVTGVSPWCAAFSKEDLEVMEYNEDVKYFYKSGPGQNMNLRLSCPLAKDMFDKFSAVESQPQGSHPIGSFYFSHATMIDMLSARLGLTEDSLPLTADNFPEQSRRQFHTSHIIPFAGNVLAVLYNCSRGEPLQIIFYQAEDIVRYPGCSVGLCEWNYIKQRFASFTQDSACTDEGYCFNKSGSAVLVTSASLVTLLAMFTALISQTQ